MATPDKRIETALTPASYAVVAEAAGYLGLSIRGFTAMAAFERAVSVVDSARRMQSNTGAHLSAEDFALVEKFLDEHPGWIEEHIKKAREDTAGIPFRKPSPEELL